MVCFMIIVAMALPRCGSIALHRIRGDADHRPTHGTAIARTTAASTHATTQLWRHRPVRLPLAQWQAMAKMIRARGSTKASRVPAPSWMADVNTDVTLGLVDAPTSSD